MSAHARPGGAAGDLPDVPCRSWRDSLYRAPSTDYCTRRWQATWVPSSDTTPTSLQGNARSRGPNRDACSRLALPDLGERGTVALPTGVRHGDRCALDHHRLVPRARADLGVGQEEAPTTGCWDQRHGRVFGCLRQPGRSAAGAQHIGRDEPRESQEQCERRSSSTEPEKVAAKMSGSTSAVATRCGSCGS